MPATPQQQKEELVRLIKQYGSVMVELALLDARINNRRAFWRRKGVSLAPEVVGMEEFRSIKQEELHEFEERMTAVVDVLMKHGA